ncbi:MAG: acyl-CoA desaturase [Ignavibacteriae bacterium]|nr:acyl-CoA desaturase [Ignavibacteriota bacterium]
MATESKKISFKKIEGCDFLSTLRERVNLHFKNQLLSSKANVFMMFKSLFLMGLVVLNYVAILSGLGGTVGTFIFYPLLGFIISSCTMNIAHDALHGAYFSRSTSNRILGFLMDLFGASSFYWKKEHTIDHHTFTNIAEHDADLDVPFLLRFCPKAPQRPFHRFQHWYAPFLYSLNLIHWVYVSDLKRIYNIFRKRSPEGKQPSPKEIFFLIFFKLLHVFLFIAFPILTLPLAWWQIVLAYLSFLAMAGLTMTTIFQLAHIVENVAFPLPNEEGKIDNSFAKHQLATTSNFAIHSKLLSFLFGGLNFQIEHHLFPHVCHIHLRHLSPIVQATAKEFGLPYYQNSSFFTAIRSHFRTLKRLGCDS